MRALAEAPQLLLNYSGVEYEYLMSWDHFDDAAFISHHALRFFGAAVIARRFRRGHSINRSIIDRSIDQSIGRSML